MNLVCNTSGLSWYFYILSTSTTITVDRNIKDLGYVSSTNGIALLIVEYLVSIRIRLRY